MVFLKILQFYGSSGSNYSVLVKSVRCMAMYPKQYINPIFCKDQQTHLKANNEISKLSHIPIKAAKNNESNSVFYNSFVNKMVNYIMKGGNKTLARELLTKTFECIKRTQIERLNLAGSNSEGIELNSEKLLLQAIENSRPVLQLTAIKRGGVKYQVPVPVTIQRSYFLAMKWLMEAAREKERHVHLPQKLAWEILDAAHGEGRVIKRKNDLHRQCESNRAYAHYRWS